MTVLEALELMLRSGIRRVYYQEGKLLRDSSSGFRYRGFVRRGDARTLDSSLPLLLPSFLLVLVRARCRWKARDTERRMGGERSNENPRAEKTAGRIGRREQIERNGPRITLRVARAIKLFKTHCRRANVSKLCKLPPPFEETLRRQICQSHLSLPFSLSPPIHFHLFPQRLSVIAFKLFEKPS